MESNISIFFIIEIIGTVAFASSGALVAIKQRLDLLGVVVLGVTTAVGGGMLRDIILGIDPFRPYYSQRNLAGCPFSHVSALPVAGGGGRNV